MTVYFNFMFSSSTTWDRSTTHPQVRPNWSLNSRPPDQDSTLHVTEMPSLTTRPSLTSMSFVFVLIGDFYVIRFHFDWRQEQLTTGKFHGIKMLER